MRLFFLAIILTLASNLFAGPIFLRTQELDPSMAKVTISEIKTNVPFIIQLNGVITESIKEDLRGFGLSLLSYLPENSFIVKAENRDILNKLDGYKKINHIVEYKPSYKYFRPSGSGKNIYTVIFFSSAPTTLSADEELLESLSQNPEVEFIEAYNQIVPMYMDLREKEKSPATGSGNYSDLDGTESGVTWINATSVYDNLGIIGKGQIVGMADTGLDVGKLDNSIHIDFHNSVIHGYNASLLSIVAPTKWDDPMGHGTHCAGSIMGRGTASNGILQGSAPGAQIVVASFWAPFINMMLVNPDFESTFNTAYSKGTKIHSNSWGGGQTPGAYDETARTMDKIAWEKQDLLMVFAAGNSGVDSNKDGKIDGGSVSSPGTAKNVLTVGASENNTKTGGIQVPISKLNGADQNWGAEPIFSDLISNNENGLAMFSSRGPTLDGRIKPDVVAPGTNILSNKSHAEGAEDLWGAFNKDYVWSGGTSMSTPITSGAAVLVREYFEREHNLKFIPSALVKATIMNGAFDMFPGQYGLGSGQEILKKRPCSDQGWGRVDLKNSIVFGNNEKIFFDNSPGLSTGQDTEYKINVTNSTRPLRITLAYTDYPGAASAGKALVNNLDLKVITPSNRVIFPNNLSGPDDMNNIETIDIKNPENGTYVLKISAYTVPQGDNYGKQPFSILATY